MARIRTIKPEFPQSESIGKLSRDARLLFIQIWTIVDDSGRARASSRMLASLLYPYDDDAKDLMEGWLSELERQEHVRRYEVDGSQYLEVVKWLEHQKIDKPSKSKIPTFEESSRIVANAREGSATDLGPSTMDLGPRIKDGAGAPALEFTEAAKATVRKYPAQLALVPDEHPKISGKQKSPEEQAKTDFYARAKAMFNGSGGQIATKLLEAKGGDVYAAMSALGAASEAGDPKTFVWAIIRKNRTAGGII